MEITSKKEPLIKQRRVVVIDMGVETPLGRDPDTFYDNFLERVSGISKIEARIAGEIKSFSTEGWVEPEFSKRMDKFTPYMMTATKKALDYGGITEVVVDELNKSRRDILIGSSLGGMKVFIEALDAL